MKTLYSLLFRSSFVLILCVTMTSCGTYNDISTGTETNLLSSDFKAASASLESNKLLQKKRNRLLYLLEKGKIEHVNKNFAVSNRLFEEAYYLVEDRGSMTGSKIGAAFTNAQAIPYAAEDFEKTTIHYYKALNFFQLGELDNALVEAKRINIKLNRLNENYKKNKNRYDEDAFAHILQGVIYEAKGNLNDAFIAYRNATDCYLRNDNAYFGVPLPEQLQKDVIRTAALLGFGDEKRKYETLFDITYDGTQESNEAVIFWENGLGPYKGQTKISLTAVGGIGAGTFENEELGIIVPIPVGANLGITAVAFPKYLQRDPFYTKATVTYGEETTPFQLVQDYGTIAEQCLKDRMGREIKDVIIRVVTKKGASKGLGAIAGHFGGGLAKKLTTLAADGINAATEKADTRNWQSLPDAISYVRVPVKEGESLTLKLYSDIATDEIILEPIPGRGLQLFNHVNFGRETGGITTSGAYAEVSSASSNLDYQDDDRSQQPLARKGNIVNQATQVASINQNANNNYKTSEDDVKKSSIGLGARYTLISNDFYELNTLEPEFTYYNNDKKIGMSVAYGFVISDPALNPYDTFGRLSAGLNKGLGRRTGVIFEGQTSNGEYYDPFFETYDYFSSFGGGIGFFYKGMGKNTIDGGFKAIVGYDSGTFDSSPETINTVYFTVGYSLLF